MSETVHYTGTIKLVNLGDLSWDDKISILKKRGFSIGPFSDESDKELDCDDLMFVGDDLYEIINKDGGSDDEDIFIAKKEPGGEISFVVKYYNGGCGFVEAIETAMESIE